MIVSLNHVQACFGDPPLAEGVDNHVHQGLARSSALLLGKNVNRSEFGARLRGELGESEPDDITVLFDDEARPPDRGLLLGRHQGESVGRDQTGVRLLPAAGVHPTDLIQVGGHPAADGMDFRHSPIMPSGACKPIGTRSVPQRDPVLVTLRVTIGAGR